MDKEELREALITACVTFAQERVARFQLAATNAQDAANSEGKSSAGDKHETGRAMAQLEREKNSKQLSEAQMLEQVALSIPPHSLGDEVRFGSAACTSNGNFFISMAAGKLEVDGTNYFAISAAAPIGQLLMGKKEGDSVEFNGKSFRIERIF